MVTAGYINGVQRTHIQLTEGVTQNIIGKGLLRSICLVKSRGFAHLADLGLVSSCVT